MLPDLPSDNNHVPNSAVAVVFILLFTAIYACGNDNYLSGLSNDDSPAACQYGVSKALDSGMYDLVLASPCANHMDRAAAHMGRAGFTISAIVDVMMAANDAALKPFRLYMNTLIGNVTGADILDLSLSYRNYEMVNTTNGYDMELEKDALFNRGALLGPIISFAFIKSSIDPDGDGAISDCDLNGNDVPDEVDATSCALLISDGSDCSGLGVATETALYNTVSFPNRLSIYNGVEIYVGAATPLCPTEYYYHLFRDWVSVSVSSLEKCADPDFPSISWNCPFEDADGEPASMLDSFNEAMQDSMGTLDSLGFDPENEVYAAVNTVTTDACGSGGAVCSATDLSTFLQDQMGF